MAGGNLFLHGALIFVKLSVLYTFLYTTLKSEDYALLIGSIGLFTILSLIMYFTRNFTDTGREMIVCRPYIPKHWGLLGIIKNVNLY